MTEWGVVGVIIALVGLVAAILKPVLSLNTSIVKLTVKMDGFQKTLDDLSTENTRNHKRIWEKVEQQGDKLEDHEERILKLEHRK